MLVIARAYGGEPLQRVATGATDALTYILHPSIASAVGAKPFSGVGFPNRDVFQFDLGVFESLCRAWQAGDSNQLDRAWGHATPIGASVMEAA